MLTSWFNSFKFNLMMDQLNLSNFLFSLQFVFFSVQFESVLAEQFLADLRQGPTNFLRLLVGLFAEYCQGFIRIISILIPQLSFLFFPSLVSYFYNKAVSKTERGKKGKHCSLGDQVKTILLLLIIAKNHKEGKWNMLAEIPLPKEETFLFLFKETQ